VSVATLASELLNEKEFDDQAKFSLDVTPIFKLFYLSTEKEKERVLGKGIEEISSDNRSSSSSDSDISNATPLSISSLVYADQFTAEASYGHVGSVILDALADTLAYLDMELRPLPLPSPEAITFIDETIQKEVNVWEESDGKQDEEKQKASDSDVIEKPSAIDFWRWQLQQGNTPVVTRQFCLQSHHVIAVSSLFNTLLLLMIGCSASGGLDRVKQTVLNEIKTMKEEKENPGNNDKRELFVGSDPIRLLLMLVVIRAVETESEGCSKNNESITSSWKCRVITPSFFSECVIDVLTSLPSVLESPMLVLPSSLTSPWFDPHNASILRLSFLRRATLLFISLFTPFLSSGNSKSPYLIRFNDLTCKLNQKVFSSTSLPPSTSPLFNPFTIIKSPNQTKYHSPSIIKQITSSILSQLPEELIMYMLDLNGIDIYLNPTLKGLENIYVKKEKGSGSGELNEKISESEDNEVSVIPHDLLLPSLLSIPLSYEEMERYIKSYHCCECDGACRNVNGRMGMDDIDGPFSGVPPSHVALCLTCGKVLCLSDKCCHYFGLLNYTTIRKRSIPINEMNQSPLSLYEQPMSRVKVENRYIGEEIMHMNLCGGLFFVVSSTYVSSITLGYFSLKPKNLFGLYVDSFGEEDMANGRGRGLYLSLEKFYYLFCFFCFFMMFSYAKIIQLLCGEKRTIET
jgi:hypothetical protein